MPWIKEELCNGCGLCIPSCILDAIIIKAEKAKIDMSKCHRCGGCHDMCPDGAICYGDSDPERLEIVPPPMSAFGRRF
jgi:MinD superfamily P-loop ATPase